MIGIATGREFPDALGGGVFMAADARRGPVLLVDRTTPLPQSIAVYLLERDHVVVAWVFGGPLAVDDDVVAAVRVWLAL